MLSRTPGQRLTRRVATLLPLPLAASPERVLINTVVVFIGVVVLLSKSLTALWPQHIAAVLASVMIGGGIATIVGYWFIVGNPKPSVWIVSLERFGCLAILLSTLAFGVRVADVYGLQGIPLGAIFFGLAAAKAIRLLVSSAARDEVLLSGEESET